MEKQQKWVKKEVNWALKNELFSSQVMSSHVWLFCDLMDCNPLGSSVRGISQARMLERVAIYFSRGIFLTQESNPCLLHWQADSFEPAGKPQRMSMI